MTQPLLYRAHGPVTVEGDGLTVVGLAAPYGQIADVDDGAGRYLETFDRGAFAHVVDRWEARRLKVQLEHPDMIGRGAWVGRGQEWNDGPDGLRVVLRLDDTTDGRAAAFKVRDGQTPAMSIAFIPGRSETVRHRDLNDDVVHRRTIRAIGHVALVPAGAYPAALVEAVRAEIAGWDDSRELVEVPPAPPAGTPRRDALAAWLADYTAR